MSKTIDWIADHIEIVTGFGVLIMVGALLALLWLSRSHTMQE